MEQIQINTSALQGADIPPEVEMLKFVYDAHPDQAGMFPIVKLLQGCWSTDPARILAFFMRDNRNLVPHARRFMGLDLLDWTEPMWKKAIDSDSWAQFAIMVMVQAESPTPPSPPAKGLMEALLDEHYEIAAGYMGFFGKDAAPGIADRWTGFYWTAYESGAQNAMATAQMINGTMKRHVPAVWDRDVDKLAAQLSKAKGMPIETCKGYLENEANAFSDASNIALQMYVLSQWGHYPDLHEEPDSEPDDADQEEEEANPIEGVAHGYLLIRQLEAAGEPTEEHLTLVRMMSKVFGFDRSTLARAVLAEGHTDQSEQEIIDDMERLEIGA